MNNKTRPKGRRNEIVEQEVDGEILIYDLTADKALCLNKTSALIWQACDGKRTVAQINDLLGRQLQTQTNEDIVWLALDQLSKEKLIEPAVDVANRFEGMSRRQVIKKIGVGSMVALPVVASLVAPTAIHAQTLLPNGAVAGTGTSAIGNCGTPGQGIRDMACDDQFGPVCASGNAAHQGTCTGGAPTTFQCVCVP